MEFSAFDHLVDERAAHWTEELVEFCRIPCETARPQELAAGARWIADRLRALGAVVETIAPDGVPPLVTAEIGAGPRTVICLQHYDVQPAAPLELWQSPPFEPALRDGRLFARGAFDNKGQLLLRIQAVEAYREAFGELPCRVRFLVEGEEESGSRHLEAMLAAQPELVAADAVLNEAGYLDAKGRPLLTCGLRGMLYVELSVRTLRGDAHSGAAVLLPNAAWRLVEALATLRQADGTVRIRGFYDDVREPSAAQLAHLRTVPFEEEALKSTLAAAAFVGGRAGFDAQVATVFAPTCNISGVWSGWNGPDVKTVIPAEARAKLDMRLVPDQDPHRILECLRRHLDEQGFADVELTTWGAEYPWWTPISHPLVDAAARVTEEIFAQPAQRVISAMGTAPLHQVCAPHDLPAVGFGCGHPDHRAHAPNENIRLDLMETATKVFGRFLPAFAALPAASDRTVDARPPAAQR